MNIIIEQQNLLIVEGKDEKEFLEELINYLGLDNIQVIDIGGKSQFKGKLKALVNLSGFSRIRSIGVIRDADADHGAAFQSVCSALTGANLPKPNTPLNSIGDSPKITVFIMPGLNMPGMLEDLCLKSIEQDHAMSCVEDYFICLSERNCPLPNNLSKAKLQVFLASKREDRITLGGGSPNGVLALGKR